MLYIVVFSVYIHVPPHKVHCSTFTLITLPANLSHSYSFFFFPLPFFPFPDWMKWRKGGNGDENETLLFVLMFLPKGKLILTVVKVDEEEKKYFIFICFYFFVFSVCLEQHFYYLIWTDHIHKNKVIDQVIKSIWKKIFWIPLNILKFERIIIYCTKPTVFYFWRCGISRCAFSDCSFSLLRTCMCSWWPGSFICTVSEKWRRKWR